MRKLNASQCKTISKPGLYRADDTLYLSVKPSGRKSWIQRVVIGGRRVDMGLGGFPVVALANARKRAFDNRAMIADDKDPRSSKRKAKIPTFREAARQTHESLKPTWTSAMHAKIWMQVLDRHAMPILADLPVDQIAKQDVLKVLMPIWSKRPDTAQRVRQRIRKILEYCQAHEYVNNNVADGAIDGALPSMSKTRGHYRALDYQEMPEAFEVIGSRVASLPSRLCLRFLILTAARSEEARGATWSEVDLGSSTWVIPGHRMKGGKTHRVPLSNSAVAVLKEALPLRNESGLVFPSTAKPDSPMTSATPMKALKLAGLGEKTVAHGFRSSFRTWAGECTDFPREVCEAALAHEVGNMVERSYNRGEMLQKRRDLMQQWADFLAGSGNG